MDFNIKLFEVKAGVLINVKHIVLIDGNDNYIELSTGHRIVNVPAQTIKELITLL